jgi:hypothetical protein
MKKILFLIAIASLAFSAPTYADDPELIDLEASIIDPSQDDDDQHKGPILVPEVSLDDHTLYFDTPCDGYTLNIVDENDVVVYTIVIPAGTTSWVLPATLSGEYELQLISGNYCFWGMITL